MDTKKPAPAVPAATVLLVRTGPAGGLEVFMIVRHHRIDFASGALVFPGGKVTEADRDLRVRGLADGAEGLAEEGLALRVAAIRETFEESGVLLARRAGSKDLLSASEALSLETYRIPLDKGELAIADFLLEHRLRLACDRLNPFAHWITPAFMPKRFDTHFYVVEAPMDQAAAHDGRESVDSVWITPSQALADGRAKTRTVIFPTRMNLEMLAVSASVNEAMSAAAARRIVTVEPWTEEVEGKRFLLIPPEAGYPVAREPLESMMG